MTLAISLQKLSKTYAGGAVGVSDVSLDIMRGTFVSLLGPSGSGKTTTLMMLAGFEEPDSGRVVIEGHDMAGVPPYERNLGMVFQNYALFPHMTVGDNISFPLEVRGRSRAERAAAVDRALALVQLDGYAGRYPRQLSGGQQQRVALARALVYDPPVLLMDEPLGALDKKLRRHMQVELKALQRKLGITVVYVTHDQEEAMSMSDVIAVMHGGAVAQFGSPADLYARPRSVFVADFLGETNFLDARQLATAGYDPAHLPLAAGRPADLYSLRPEAIRLVGAESAPVVASVANRVFLGDCERIEVTLAGGTRLWLRAQADSSAAPVTEGQKVGLAWAQVDMVPLRRGDGD
jgi:putative spermidine/putrescine transport system ATP-binding protein